MRINHIKSVVFCLVGSMTLWSAGLALANQDKPASDDTPIETAVTGGDGRMSGEWFINTGVGFKFTPKVDIIITDVGWITPPNGFLNASHEIGIWAVDDPYNPLDTWTVTPTKTTDVDAGTTFTWTAASLTLHAGREYLIMGVCGSDFSDASIGYLERGNFTPNTTLEIGKGPNGLLGAYVTKSNSLAYPEEGPVDDSSTQGFLYTGPNFKFKAVKDN